MLSHWSGFKAESKFGIPCFPAHFAAPECAVLGTPLYGACGTEHYAERGSVLFWSVLFHRVCCFTERAISRSVQNRTLRRTGSVLFWSVPFHGVCCSGVCRFTERAEQNTTQNGEVCSSEYFPEGNFVPLGCQIELARGAGPLRASWRPEVTPPG
eukprot:6688686-Alexandrium_andersonii.AAC.1